MTVEHWSRFVCNLPTRDGHARSRSSDWYGAEVPRRSRRRARVGRTRRRLEVGHDGDRAVVGAETSSAARPGDVLVPPRDGTMLDGRRIERELEQIHAVNPIRAVVMDMHNAEATGAVDRP
jgi:hypothetical protein